MKDKHIAQLEAQLENLIEGAFAHFFGRHVRAQDIALHLARAMEDGLKSAGTDDPRPIAPDYYEINLNAQSADHLIKRQTDLTNILSKHMVELATNSGYKLDNPPIIDIIARSNMTSGEINVTAQHTSNSMGSTNVLDRVTKTPRTDAPPPQNPHLILGKRTIPINEPIVNIGRGLSNHIVLEDPHISRHHAQLRLRFGSYTLFDVQSRAGTYVNNVRIREHTLASGDVIKMGDTRLIYMEEESSARTTSQLPAVPMDDL